MYYPVLYTRASLVAQMVKNPSAMQETGLIPVSERSAGEGIGYPTPVFLPGELHGQKPLACHAAATAAKSLQSCLTLCDPIDGSPQGSPIPGILQARTLEWVAIMHESEK